MKDLIYQQVPLATSDLRCSICKQLLMTKKSEKIMIYGRHNRKQKEISEKLYYCDKHKIGYVTRKMVNRIEDDYKDYEIATFSVSDISLKEMKEKIAFLPQKNIHIGTENYRNEYIHPHNGCMEYPMRMKEMSVPVTIYTTNIEYGKCPICNLFLYKDHVKIPVGKDVAIKWYGKSCDEHFITKNSIKLQRLLKGNPYAQHIRIDDKYCIENYFKIKQVFDDEEGADILILLKKESSSKKGLALIVGNEAKNIGGNIRILNYREKPAREILTSVFHDKKKQFLVNNESYYMFALIDKDDKEYSTEPEYLLYDVLIKQGGGYSWSIKNNRYELVDVLLYSPFSDCYELAKAIFDKDNYEYFMDISIYKNFVYKFGNPGIFLSTGYYDYTGDNINLREESILHAFGYSVSRADNLSQTERQNLLSEVIDLQLMKQESIVSLLESLIAMRKSQSRYTEACYKWEQDIKYVISYKANPERFIISSS